MPSDQIHVEEATAASLVRDADLTLAKRLDLLMEENSKLRDLLKTANERASSFYDELRTEQARKLDDKHKVFMQLKSETAKRIALQVELNKVTKEFRAAQYASLDPK